MYISTSFVLKPVKINTAKKNHTNFRLFFSHHTRIQHMASSQGEKRSNNDTFGMLVVAGMVATAAGMTMYTKRAGTMLKQMDQISKNKAKRMPATKIGPMAKTEWDKVRPRFDKDEFV
jgi:hypothetical protein